MRVMTGPQPEKRASRVDLRAGPICAGTHALELGQMVAGALCAPVPNLDVADLVEDVRANDGIRLQEGTRHVEVG